MNTSTSAPDPVDLESGSKSSNASKNTPKNTPEPSSDSSKNPLPKNSRIDTFLNRLDAWRFTRLVFEWQPLLFVFPRYDQAFGKEVYDVKRYD